MRTTLALVVALCAVLVSTTAFAQDYADKDGVFGLGFGPTLEGSPGLSARFNLGVVDIEGLVGANIQQLSDAADNTVKSSRWDVSLLVNAPFVISNQATLAGFAGVNLGFVDPQGTGAVDDPEADNSYMDLAFGLGLRGEVFLTEYFSIFGRGTFLIDPISQQEAGAEDAGGTNFSIFRGGLLGMFGFTVWFG